MTSAQANNIKNMDLFIIDEISMLNKKNLCRIDIILRNIRGCDLCFGGVHLLLAGDFFQLPPVSSGMPLYVDISTYKTPNQEDIIGFKLWRQITSIVLLTFNHRQFADPEWANGCRNARKGIWNNNFIDIINSRCVPDTSLAHLFDDSLSNSTKVYAQQLLKSFNNKNYIPLITPSNDLRNVIINTFVFQCSKKLPNSDLPIRLVAQFGFEKKKKTASIIKI